MNIQQQIYNHLCDPSELEECACELDALPSISDMGDDDSHFVKRCATLLSDCQDKFYAIKQIADSLPVLDEEDPISEWSDDALHDELFNIKERIVGYQLEGLDELVRDLREVQRITDELYSEERQQ